MGKEECPDEHRRYFQIAGITVCMESDLDFNEVKFKKELTAFSVSGPGEDNVVLRLYFESPDLKGMDLGREVYRKAPWVISRANGTWYYREISPFEDNTEQGRFAEFTADYMRAKIFISPQQAEDIRNNGYQSLALLTTDQIWLAPLLADRHAVLLHSAGLILNGQGLLLVGHSDAGKSTVTALLKNAAATSSCKTEILCDDRNIARRWNDGWRVHGTWSHGDVADVSPASAPLRAVLFLKQDTRDEITPLVDRWEIRKRLLATLIKPMVTAEWWQKEMDVIEQMIAEVPFYLMRFTRSGDIVEQLMSIAADRESCVL